VIVDSRNWPVWPHLVELHPQSSAILVKMSRPTINPGQNAVVLESSVKPSQRLPIWQPLFGLKEDSTKTGLDHL